MAREVILMVRMRLDSDIDNNEDLLEHLAQYGKYEMVGSKDVKIYTARAIALFEVFSKKDEELLN